MAEPKPEIGVPEIGLEYGRVTGGGGGYFMVDLGGEPRRARRALSCVVKPEPGDLALVSRDTFGRVYLLSVLEREETETVLSFPGDVSIRSEAGRASLAAPGGIDLATAGDMNLIGSEVKLAGGSAEAVFDSMRLISRALDGRFEKARISGTTLDTFFDRVAERVKRSYKWVSESEHKRAGALDYVVDKVLGLRGRYAVVTAEKDVRVDGDHILMG